MSGRPSNIHKCVPFVHSFLDVHHTSAHVYTSIDVQWTYSERPTLVLDVRCIIGCPMDVRGFLGASYCFSSFPCSAFSFLPLFLIPFFLYFFLPWLILFLCFVSSLFLKLSFLCLTDGADVRAKRIAGKPTLHSQFPSTKGT